MPSETFAKLEGFTRGFEDGLSESIFTRDWRESRVELKEHLTDVPKRDVDPNVLVIDTSGVSVPANKDPSALSAATSVQGPQSPTQSKASNITVIDVDSGSDTMSTTKEQGTGKRKASALSYDDIEIIEGPILATNSGKKQKSKVPPAAKTRARKK